MIPVLRFCAAFLVAALCIPVLSCLTLICADFAGLENFLDPRPGWRLFGAISAAALALPPAMHAWPDPERSSGELIREGLRAVLLSFAPFALLLLAGARPFFEWLNVPAPMTAVGAANLAPVLACPLAFLSYRVSRTLLPRPAPEKPVPAVMTCFGWLALAFTALVAFQPWITGTDAILFSGKLSLFCAAWGILALRHVLLEHAEAGFIPLWGALCTICIFRLGSAFTYMNATELAFSAALLLVMVASNFCLMHSENHRWFL